MLVSNSGDCVLDSGEEKKEAGLKDVLCRDLDSNSDDTLYLGIDEKLHRFCSKK